MLGDDAPGSNPSASEQIVLWGKDTMTAAVIHDGAVHHGKFGPRSTACNASGFNAARTLAPWSTRAAPER